MRQVERVEWAQFVDPVWSLGRHPVDFWTGHDIGGWEASVWILHAMYEHPQFPSSLTHDDVERIERAAEPRDPSDLTEVERIVHEMGEESWLVGSPVGGSSSPGADWSRLHWRELAARLGIDLFGEPYVPCLRTFPYDSWPASIQPPAEGSLDLEQLERLIAHAADLSPHGVETECIWWHSALGTSGNEALVYRGALRDAAASYMADGWRGAGNNFWPLDRAWWAYSDYDLWGTKVSGSREFVDALLADPGLETVELELGDWPPSA